MTRRLGWPISLSAIEFKKDQLVSKGISFGFSAMQPEIGPRPEKNRAQQSDPLGIIFRIT